MSSSVAETINIINRDSGLSDNQLAYRLALMMEKFPPSSIQTTPVLDTKERETIMGEMRNILSLSQKRESTEDYRLSLKEKYLKEYTEKYGLNKGGQTPEISNSQRIEDLIANRKKTFLQEILQSKGRKLPNVNRPVATSESNNPSVAKKSLIPALMNIIDTRGQETNDGRVYEGKFYKLQLLIQQGMQLLSVWRNNSNQSAFTAQKADSSLDYQVTHNDLSSEETDKLINFDQKQRQQERQLLQQKTQPQHQIQQRAHQDGPELD